MRTRIVGKKLGYTDYSMKWMLLLAVVIALFFWKLLFTGQFSVLMSWEAANQAYAWNHFSAAMIKQGAVPVWDPYTFVGHSFVGEMQTALFYPPKMILYLWPFTNSGLSSTRLYHYYYVFSHLLAGWFMFLLARQLGLNGFPGFVASVCFAVGGLVGKAVWPDMVDTAVWLPLILLFLIRALDCATQRQRVLNACLTGLMLGMAILAGRIHLAIMDALVIAGAAVYWFFHQRRVSNAPVRDSLRRNIAVVAIVGLVAFGFGAVQLLPSIEYGMRAVRWIGQGGPMALTERIPYERISETHRLWPRSLLAFLFGNAEYGDAEFSPYMGVLTLLLATIGVWRNWERPWVRFLAGLAILAFFYGLGSYSFLHQLLYLLVPFLYVAREAGRFIYLTQFAIALLAGFGVKSLLSEETALTAQAFAPLSRVIRWILIVALIVLGAPVLYGKPPVNEWHFVSLIFLIASYAILLYVVRGHRSIVVKLIVLLIIVSDLSVYEWTTRGIIREHQSGKDYLEALLGARDLANFFNAQPGLFRVKFAMDLPPNIGDLYGVQCTDGAGVTYLKDQLRFEETIPRAFDMLNVRYVVKTGSKEQERLVYVNGDWRVYENATYCPRAWVVHNIITERSKDLLLRRIADPGFDPLHTAFVREALDIESDNSGLEVSSQNSKPAEVAFESYSANSLELSVNTGGPGLLVLSEIDYPGWRARVNESTARIYRVNGILRGVVVPAGKSRVTLRYIPASVVGGAVLTLVSLGGVLLFAIIVWRDERPGSTRF